MKVKFYCPEISVKLTSVNFIDNFRIIIFIIYTDCKEQLD